ncbi:hypothetical protein V8D89_013333 [Ganoderma adspersum]
MSSFPSLTELSLLGVTFPSFGFFRRMIIAIPSLTNLTLSKIRWPHTSIPAWLTLPERSPRQLNLCTLRLDIFVWPQDVIDVLLPWLSKTIAAETIDSLVVQSPPEHLVEHDFFKHVGPHVAKLTIDLQSTGLNAGNPGTSAFHCAVASNPSANGAAGLLFGIDVLPSESAEFDIPH